MAVPEPIEFIRTRWLADRDSCGSYSYLALGSSTADRLALRTPVDGRLRFAGEASAVDQPATVSGAILEGRRTAQEIASAGGRTVVVGAGAAGLACASSLCERGLEVTIVEARDRLGGRVHTTTMGSARVDLGASWIHGLVDNPLTELVEQSGATIQPTRTLTVRRDDGSPVDERDVADGFEVVETVRATTSAASEGSLADHFDRAIETLGSGAAVVARAIVAFEIEQSEGADLAEASIECIHERHVPSGDDALTAEGLDRALAELARGLDVRLGRRIRTILVEDHGVAVFDDHGTALRADHCVVTAPLGVLQAGHITFTPSLPDPLRRAITRLGISRLEKVACRFSDRFWDDTDVILLAAEGFDITVWTNLERVTGEPVLVGSIAGRTAAAMRDSSDAEVRAAALRSLNAMFG